MSVKSMSPKYRNLRCYRYKSESDNLSGYLRQMQAKTGVIKDAVMESVMKDLGFHFEDQTAARSLYTVDTLYEGLRNYDAKQTFAPSQKSLSDAFLRVSKIYESHFGTLTAASPEVVLRMVRKDAAASAPYFCSKEEVIDTVLDSLDEADKHPCVAYYRTQARMQPDASFKQSVRLVWGFPFAMTILEGQYARPLIDLFKSVDTPYALGFRKAELGARLNSFSWKNFVGSFDWSKFDSTMPAQIISLTFKLMRKFFTEVDEDTWQRIVKYFIFTPILMPNGKVYVGKNHGIPSGSYFTNLVGSLANLLMMEYLSIECKFKLQEVLVHGDDSIVASNQELPLKEMALVAAQHFGMTLHPDKQRYTKKDHNLEFLSHMWIGGRPYRDNIETAQHLVYAERGHSKNVDPKEVRINKLLQLYGDNYEFWPHIVNYLRLKGLVKPDTYANFRVSPKALMHDPDIAIKGKVPICLLSIR